MSTLPAPGPGSDAPTSAPPGADRQPRRRVAPALRDTTRGISKVARRIPRAAWICALIAFLNASAWSIITPPFQGRDEIDHFAYIAHLAEQHSLPHSLSGPPNYPTEEKLVLEGLNYWQVRFTPYTPSISSVAQQQALTSDVNAGDALYGAEGGNASSEPPLFYVLQLVPYEIGSGNVLVQLQLMRLLSALIGGITVLLTFLFLRELLPSVPWAATIGALCVALQPQFAFVSGSLNPSVLLYALSAAVFLCLARGFRRRLSARLAVALGATIAAGFITYFSFIGVAVGALIALAILATRDARSRGRGALLAPALATGISVAPVAAYVVRNALVGSSLSGATSTVGGAINLQSLFHEVSYIWEMYLPRLPGMTRYFAGISTWKDIWFDRSVGLYGWMDTMLPPWVDNLALILAVGVLALCGREMLINRASLRARLPELAGYAAIAIGLLTMLGITSYVSDVINHELAYGESRYLLPLLPLLGAVVALAIRGAGRRWMPVAGAAIVILFVGHDLFSQLQVIARYYG
jgi:hypothetical protein